MATIPKNTFQFKKYGQPFQTKEQKNWLKDKSHAAIYHSSQWKKLREMFLSKHPFCVECKRKGYFIDHIIPISEGGEMYNESNLQTLCKSCNGRKTVNQRYLKK